MFEHAIFSVTVTVPHETPPAEGFPVIIVLDGERYAPLMHAVQQLQIRNRQKTGVQPAIIVGIDHRAGQGASLAPFRFYYMTPPAERYVFPTRRGRVMEEMKAGGAPELHTFIETIVKPYVNAHYETNDAFFLFGHSLGGLYALWSYTMNHAYAGIIAVSPSLWWNEQQLLQHIPLHDIPLAVFVGGEEGDMVDDAKSFSAALALHKAHTCYVAPLENHASVIPTIMSRALRFVHAVRNDRVEVQI